MSIRFRKILKVSLLIIAVAISLAILSACNGNQSALPSEYFEGDCLTKGFTRYYMPNGTYIDREDAEFGEHAYGDGTVISVLSCTTDGETVYTCSLCGHEHRDVQEKLGHAYIETVTKEPTCTEKGSKILNCARCGDTVTADIAKLDHDYEVTVIEQATCTQKGSMSMTCRVCHTTEVREIDTLPHVSDGEIHYNSEAHWSVCEICTNIFDYTEHKLESTQVAATCVEHAYTYYECSDCDYHREVIDESSLLSHRYEAYTCLGCQRDKLLDYKAEFDSKGANASNLIQIESQEKFVCFYDYLITYQITEPKYIKITYATVKVEDEEKNTFIAEGEEEVNDFLAKARYRITATNWSVRTMYSYNKATSVISYFYMNATNSGNFVFDEVASYTPDDYSQEYQNSTCVQYDSYQFQYNSSRTASFDDFAYKSRINEMAVSSSDQLFFAFEHGYKPIAVSNSPAADMLEKAKAVARRIMDDSMTDLEKLRAIYCYLVSDVAYDYGIVEMTNSASAMISYAKCSSYYLEGVFNYKIAVCDGISKAFCVLAGLEDIKCVRITSENHAWNKVYIDVNGDGQKEWFCTDATWGNQGVLYNNEKGEYLSVEDFLFTDAQKANRGQRGRNYTDTNSDATTEANPYEYFYFDEAEDASCDFVIASKSELYSLIDYLKANFGNFKRGDIVTVNMYIVSTYWAENEISNNLYSELRNQWSVVGATAAITIGDNAITYGDVTGYSTAIIIPIM